MQARHLCAGEPWCQRLMYTPPSFGRWPSSRTARWHACAWHNLRSGRLKRIFARRQGTAFLSSADLTQCRPCVCGGAIACGGVTCSSYVYSLIPDPTSTLHLNLTLTSALDLYPTIRLTLILLT